MKNFPGLRSAGGLAMLFIALGNAHAHIVLEEQSAPAGSSYRAVFRVGHGCDGSATTGIRVVLPDGIVGAKPMPKPGWTIDIKSEPLKEPFTVNGRKAESRVSEVSWTGGLLPDAWYDEFVIRMTLPASPGKRWFKVYQTCESGHSDWIEVPAAGQAELKRQAPGLDIVPAKP
jgi:uncharacterized protein YcnI